MFTDVHMSAHTHINVKSFTFNFYAKKIPSEREHDPFSVSSGLDRRLLKHCKHEVTGAPQCKEKTVSA